MHTFDEDEESLFVRSVGTLSKKDYDALYERILKKTRHYGSTNVYEEVIDFGFLAFLSISIGTWHDLKYGHSINFNKHAIVSDSFWAKTVYNKMRFKKPVSNLPINW